jgi:hypothetical protein
METACIAILKNVSSYFSKRENRKAKQVLSGGLVIVRAEMLESHMVEIKDQEKSKLQHPEPLACTKLLYATLY